MTGNYQKTMANYPCEEVRAFGELISSALLDASVRKGFAGLGGCMPYHKEDFPPETWPYIEAYLEGENDSVAIMYAAMRTKEQEVNDRHED